MCVDFMVTNHGGCARSVISSHKRLRKTFISTQQARGTTGGNRELWVGRIKVTEITRQPRGGVARLLDSEIYSKD